MFVRLKLIFYNENVTFFFWLTSIFFNKFQTPTGMNYILWTFFSLLLIALIHYIYVFLMSVLTVPVSRNRLTAVVEVVKNSDANSNSTLNLNILPNTVLDSSSNANLSSKGENTNNDAMQYELSNFLKELKSVA